MLRLWLTAGAAICLGGCAVRNVEGRWQGALPFEDADACQVLLQKGGRFEFGCAPKDAGWSGTGTWSEDAEGLELRFERVWRGEAPLDRTPMPLKVRYGERGNELRPEGALWVREL